MKYLNSYSTLHYALLYVEKKKGLQKNLQNINFSDHDIVFSIIFVPVKKMRK